ncbi:MAG TPA: oligopeptide/dipeptide ABC transporter ATP-binding protein [Steroidobacteraceae bacterium]
MNAPLLQVKNLRVEFAGRPAVRDVNFDLTSGETIGLVGESGSGKSTLARALLRLLQPEQGSVEFSGLDLLKSTPAAMRAQRRDLQIIFQDPLASLNPRMTVGGAIAEPLLIFEPELSAAARWGKVVAMLERVGLAAGMAKRYPHEFSGGQCQRIGIARATVLRPKLLVCDEAVSSLDVSIQGQIINLLLDLQQEMGMAMLFISHNLAVVRHLSHRVLVMYLGKLVEAASCEALFAAPVHPYTRALLSAVPRIPPVAGARASTPLAEASLAADSIERGCAFRDRCPYALPLCASSDPPLAEIAAGRWVACHRSHETLNPLF